MNIYGILVPLGFDNVFDYKSDLALDIGDLVSVPFRNKELIGIVYKIGASVENKRIKEIKNKIDLPPISAEMIKFMEFVSGYTLSPRGAVLKMMLNYQPAKKTVKKAEIKTPTPEFSKINFTQEQLLASKKLMQKINNGFSCTLLHGITGSGKTEVYFEAIAKALKENKQVLVLLPEIALTSQFIKRFEKRFGAKPLMWHSSILPKARRETFEVIATGEAKVLVGARSGLFLPFKNLGLIVVDESHDSTFKQEDGVKYNGRDMAVMRSFYQKIPTILATATPDLETLVNVEEGKYEIVELKERYSDAKLPTINILDLKEQRPAKGQFLSPILIEEIKQTLSRKEQVILFLNRRGYAPLIICQDCGFRIECPNCSSWLTAHRNNNSLICHHCGHLTPYPKKCPDCGSENGLTACGPGVERIDEEVGVLFPDANIEVISSDITDNPKKIAEVIKRMENKEIDILIGTQILAKGHHFKDLTLVGVIDADLGLTGSDLRASERTFQLLSQVSGRAGREDKEGKVYLQTYNPENQVLKAIVNNDMNDFIKIEKQTRKMLKMPPYGNLASIIVSADNQNNAEHTAFELAKTAPNTDYIITLGPSPAPIFMLRGKYRYRLLLKTHKSIKIQQVIKKWLQMINLKGNVNIDVDVNPYNFM
ncbi:MAG: primosomal protein N' [Alphaproteobacteria bacterium]